MNKFFKLSEIRITLIISIILCIILIYLNKIPSKLDYDIFLSISSTLFGFLITSLSILLVFPNEGRIKLLKRHNNYESVYQTFLISIIFLILLFILSLVGNFYGDFYIQRIVFLFFLILVLLFLILDLWILKRMINLLFIND